MRHRLTRDTTFFVGPNGSDLNDGSSPDLAFFNPGIAYAYISENFDMCGHTAILQFLDGTYTSGITTYAVTTGGPNTLLSGIIIMGNLANPENVIISTSNTPCLSATFGTLAIGGGFTLESENASAIYCAAGARVAITGHVSYGKCGQYHLHATTNSVISDASHLQTIIGGASAHYMAQSFSSIIYTPQQVRIENTPTFELGFAVAIGGYIVGSGSSFTGEIGHGASPRYAAYQHSVIDTAGLGETYYPGNCEGTVHAPAIYV